MINEEVANNSNKKDCKLRGKIKEMENQITEFENNRWKDYGLINMYRLRLEVLEKCLLEVLSSIALDEDKIKGSEVQQRNTFLLVNGQEHKEGKLKQNDLSSESPTTKNVMSKARGGISRTQSSSDYFLSNSAC